MDTTSRPIMGEAQSGTSARVTQRGVQKPRLHRVASAFHATVAGGWSHFLSRPISTDITFVKESMIFKSS